MLSDTDPLQIQRFTITITESFVKAVFPQDKASQYKLDRLGGLVVHFVQFHTLLDAVRYSNKLELKSAIGSTTVLCT